MILVWDGSTILSIDLDREIPGPRAEAVARLIEPTYLRGYLEGRRKEAGRAMLRNNDSPIRAMLKLTEISHMIRKNRVPMCRDHPHDALRGVCKAMFHNDLSRHILRGTDF